MSHRSPKRGVLVRVCGLQSDPDDADQDEKDHVRDRKQFLEVHNEAASDIHLNERKFTAKTVALNSNRKSRHRSSKMKSQEAGQSHDNPAFLNDDNDSIAVTKYSTSIVCPVSGSDSNQLESLTKMQTNVYSQASSKDCHVSRLQQTLEADTIIKDTRLELYSSPGEHTNMACSATSTVAGDGERDNISQSSMTQNQDTSEMFEVASGIAVERNLEKIADGDSSHQLSDISSRQHTCVDNVRVVSLTHKQRTSASWATRPHSRSLSTAASSMFSRGVDDSQGFTDQGSQAAHRSYSMRLPSTDDTEKPKARALLRDLSFSDTDGETIRNYGSLRGGFSMTKRKESAYDDSNEDIHIHMGPEVKSQVRNLMQELISRGKVRQMALLSQQSCSMLVSVPPWELSHCDEIGLVKAVTTTAQTITRLTVGQEAYMFFKHGPDKIMGRSGEIVLVAQRTKVCVVVGVADDNTPGSCLYEVSEFVNTMVNKGW